MRAAGDVMTENRPSPTLGDRTLSNGSSNSSEMSPGTRGKVYQNLFSLFACYIIHTFNMDVYIYQYNLIC